ncbi:MAG: holo-ACP synthase [Bacillota bacterium]
MPILAHGIDIITTSRVADLLERHPERALERLLTPAEQAYCQAKADPVPHIAARFAAKESVAKALGTGLRGFRWTDIEIISSPLGQPEVRLHQGAAQAAARRGIQHILISLSHCREYAVASAIAIGGE